MDYKLSEENAKEQLNLFFKYYDVSPDYLMSSKDRIVGKIILGLRLGKIEFAEQEGLTIIQHVPKTISSTGDIKYGEITGLIRIELEKYKDGIEKIYAVIRMISQEDDQTFKKMSGLDILIAECIGALFLIL